MLPRNVQLWLADSMAAIGWRLLPEMHSRVRENVRNVLGPAASPAEVERVARGQWRNYMRYMRDFAALPHSAEPEIEDILARAEGWEHIDEAMAAGRGLVLVSAHFGNWDLAAGAMARRHSVSVIADTFSSSRVDSAINERRMALGLKVIPIEKALKRTVSALRRNEAVAFLADKPLAGDSGVEVELCGLPTRIPAGAAYFASRVGAPLIVAFVWRDANGRLTGKVLPPVSLEGDVGAIMQRVAAHLSAMIRQQPEQWYMFRRMWTAAPAAEKRAECMEEAVA